MRAMLFGSLFSRSPRCPPLAALAAGSPAPAFEAQASPGRDGLHLRPGCRAREGTGRALFLSGRVHAGCTIEAHDFAEHIDDFKELGATVIGVSGDDIATLDKFSVSECRSKFAVASDGDHAISKEYDAL